jgi:acyl-CoA dehydrogenase
MWDFSTEPAQSERLSWMKKFVHDEIEPLDLNYPGREYERPTLEIKNVVEPLKQRVRDRGLWACHLPPNLGGQGSGQVELALMNEILGRSNWAPIVFGCQAPDSGNAEIIAKFGTSAQKERYLAPLLAGEIFSSYSMTEPHAGSDPSSFTTTATRAREGWVLRGEKYFSSHANSAEFLIVMAVTDMSTDVKSSLSLFRVPTDADGVRIIRNVGTIGQPLNEGNHGWIVYDDVLLPPESLLGEVGQGFAIAQHRLSGGRIHHAMRTVGLCQRAFDMLCERAVSRRTRGELLSEKQLVQAAVADCWIELWQLRLLVMHTSWLIDTFGPEASRKEISGCKIAMSRAILNIVSKALHLHGAMGVSNETPLADMWMRAPALSIVDGPTEVHQISIAKQLLKIYTPSQDSVPTEWIPAMMEKARNHLLASSQSNHK